MKKILLFIALIFTISIQAENYVDFKLQRDGSFIANDGKYYSVVEFKDKTAQELYSIVKSNIMKFYNNYDEVMSENEPQTITIYTLSEILKSAIVLKGGFASYRAYYTYTLHFKDGKIKVDAPIINQSLDVKCIGYYPKTFESLIEDWFDKNGKVKSKCIDDITKIENIFNSPLNYILSNLNNEQPEEDW